MSDRRRRLLHSVPRSLARQKEEVEEAQQAIVATPPQLFSLLERVMMRWMQLYSSKKQNEREWI
jgi:hypothetical protein